MSNVKCVLQYIIRGFFYFPYVRICIQATACYFTAVVLRTGKLGQDQKSTNLNVHFPAFFSNFSYWVWLVF